MSATRRKLQFAMQMLSDPAQRKHTLWWLWSQQREYLLRSRLPWLTFDVIHYLNGLDLRRKRVFEFGSGGSTLYWLRRGSECVSVEHDPEWFALVRARSDQKWPIDYRLVPPEPESSRAPGDDPADPDAYTSGSEAYRGYAFRRYVSQIDDFPEEHFDIVLVDGRARPSCLKHSARRVRRSGLLIVDNADRDYYFAQTRQYLDGYERHVFAGAGPLNDLYWTTHIYVRVR